MLYFWGIFHFCFSVPDDVTSKYGPMRCIMTIISADCEGSDVTIRLVNGRHALTSTVRARTSTVITEDASPSLSCLPSKLSGFSRSQCPLAMPCARLHGRTLSTISPSLAAALAEPLTFCGGQQHCPRRRAASGAAAQPRPPACATACPGATHVPSGGVLGPQSAANVNVTAQLLKLPPDFW